MDQTDWTTFSPNSRSDSTPYHEFPDHDNILKIESDPYLMNQIEQTFHENHPHLPQSDFEHMNFVLAEDLGLPQPSSSSNTPAALQSSSQDDSNPNNVYDSTPDHHHNGSSAFPPSTSSTNTPSLLAHKHLSSFQDPAMVVSPILPSQNDKSFNNQHYYYKFQKGKSSSAQPQSVNGVSNGEAYEHQPQHQHVRPDAVFTPLMSPNGTPLDTSMRQKHPVQATFEPLTSPALNTQISGLASSNDSRRRPSSSKFAPQDDPPSTYKRKTPHGTPILVASNNSSSAKVKTSPSAFDKLPESSIDSSNPTPMLPPQGRKIEIDEQPMMGFTMGKLAKQQANESSVRPTRSRKSSYASSKSSDTSPNLTASNDGSATNLTTTRSREKPTTKKASHKLAEQGRRNRMNMAVYDLGTLVPQSYHDQVSVPSKATTVELASKYIRDLLQQVEELKKSKGSR